MKYCMYPQSRQEPDGGEAITPAHVQQHAVYEQYYNYTTAVRRCQWSGKWRGGFVSHMARMAVIMGTCMERII